MIKSGETSAKSAPWIVLSLGATLYLFSFAINAIDEIPGWWCAFYALWPWNIREASNLAFFGGLINPLVFLYFLLTVLNRGERLRTILAAAILFCIPLTWIALDRMNKHPETGHFLWIAGVLLLISPVVPKIPDTAGAKWLASCALLIFVAWVIPAGIRLTMHRASARDDFFYVVAWNFQQPTICSQIDPRATGREDQRDEFSSVTYMQSDCYRAVSVLQHDPALCDNVKSAGIDRMVGSLLAKSQCRTHRYTQGTAWPADGESFVSMMHTAGYEDAQVSDWFYHRNELNSTLRQEYQNLRKDPAFVRHVMSGPSYAEAVSVQNLRPAKSAEYLYEMMAVDGNDPSLCEKISPNATHQWNNGRTYALRSLCYWDIAFNRRDAALCERLPHMESASLVYDYGSEEGCVKNIAVLRRPGANLDWATSGPTSFPERSQFQDALEQIGYPQGVDAAQAPKPTDAEYTDFFFDVSRSNRGSARSDFLARVSAMK